MLTYGILSEFVPAKTEGYDKNTEIGQDFSLLLIVERISLPSGLLIHLGYRYFAYINDMLWLSLVKDPFHGQKAFAKNLLDIIACIIL